MKLIFAASLLLTSAAIAQTSVVTRSTTISATAAATPAEQFANAERILHQMTFAPAAQKPDLFAAAWATLSTVRHAWPNDSEAVAKSGVMQADLAAEFNAWPNAVAVLNEVLPVAPKTSFNAAVERRLGEAYDHAGDSARAEQHLLAAERVMRSSHLDRSEQHAILNSTALFYARRGKPSEAIQRFRDLQNLPGENQVSKLTAQIAIVEQSIQLGAEAAREELARFDALVVAARHGNLTAGDAAAVTNMVEHAQRIRAARHL